MGKYIGFWQAVTDSNLIIHWNYCNHILYFYFYQYLILLLTGYITYNY